MQALRHATLYYSYKGLRLPCDYVVQTIVANESPLILVYRASMAYSWTGV